VQGISADKASLFQPSTELDDADSKPLPHRKGALGKKKVRPPGLEPGLLPWEGNILPLDDRRRRAKESLRRRYDRCGKNGHVMPGLGNGTGSPCSALTQGLLGRRGSGFPSRISPTRPSRRGQLAHRCHLFIHTRQPARSRLPPAGRMVGSRHASLARVCPRSGAAWKWSLECRTDW
jgi:hypothetical protein